MAATEWLIFLADILFMDGAQFNCSGITNIRNMHSLAQGNPDEVAHCHFQHCLYSYEICQPLLTCILYSSINNFLTQCPKLQRRKKTASISMNYANFTYLHNSTRMLCGYFSVLTTATHLFFQFLAQPGRMYVTSDSHTKLPLCLKYPKIKLRQNSFISCKE